MLKDVWEITLKIKSLAIINMIKLKIYQIETLLLDLFWQDVIENF